jgi:hypothetical protein
VEKGMSDHDERERRRLQALAQQRTRLEDDRAGVDLDENRTWLPKACIVCGDETRLRCGRCRMAVCHFHEHCPNHCDDPVVDDAFTPLRGA